jgi:hypothetical protein
MKSENDAERKGVGGRNLFSHDSLLVGWHRQDSEARAERHARPLRFFLGSFLRQRRNRAALCLKTGLVSEPVRQPLAGRVLDRHGCTFPIVVSEPDSVIVAEIEFRQISV